MGVQQIVVAEGMLLGQRLGLDPAILAGVINSSTGGCWASSVNNPVPGALVDHSAPCERDYEGGFATALMLKVRLTSTYTWGPVTNSTARIWGWPRALLVARGALYLWEKLLKGSMRGS